jgi:nucleoid DNA-binding protein
MTFENSEPVNLANVSALSFDWKEERNSRSPKNWKNVKIKSSIMNEFAKARPN